MLNVWWETLKFNYRETWYETQCWKSSNLEKKNKNQWGKHENTYSNCLDQEKCMDYFCYTWVDHIEGKKQSSIIWCYLKSTFVYSIFEYILESVSVLLFTGQLSIEFEDENNFSTKWLEYDISFDKSCSFLLRKCFKKG